MTYARLSVRLSVCLSDPFLVVAVMWVNAEAMVVSCR